MIDKKYFLESINKFRQIEKRANFYDIAREIVNDYPIQACIIILAVWNVGNFRHVKNREQFLFEFESTFEECKPLFKKLENMEFQNADFYNIHHIIKEIYTKLSKIKGVGFTGASKVMHLINPNLFVIWDSYISGQKPKKYYKGLDLVKNYQWVHKRYERDADGYIDFLKDMQVLFKDINLSTNGRTFAKVIDEFNYINITIPIQEKTNKRRP